MREHNRGSTQVQDVPTDKVVGRMVIVHKSSKSKHQTTQLSAGGSRNKGAS